MKIVHIISGFNPGGAEVFVRDLSVELSREYGAKQTIIGIYQNRNNEFAEKYFEKNKERLKNRAGFSKINNYY